MKIKQIIGLFFMLTVCANSPAHSYHHDKSIYHHPHVDFGDINSLLTEDIVNPDITEMMNNFDNAKYAVYYPSDIVRALTRSTCASNSKDINIELQNILKEDIYRFTYPLNTRSLHDLTPWLYTFGLPLNTFSQKKYYGGLFYNETLAMHFTRNGKGIASYLKFDDNAALNRIDDLSETFGLKTLDILELFKNLKAQERRLGIMFGTLQHYNKWVFEIRTPLVYQIRNLFLTPEEALKIKNQPIFQDDNPTTDRDAEMIKFARKHLISDRLGFGDTRLNIGYTIKKDPRHHWLAGIEATLPTAFSLKKGLYGSHFKQDNNNPPFNLLTMYNLASDPSNTVNTNKALEILETYLLGVLDTFSSILIEAPLGNRGHLGLGLFSEHYMPISIDIKPDINFYSRASIEYLIPSTEKRFFITKKDPAVFDALVTDPASTDCVKTVSFLNQQIHETLFPFVADTTVYPGFTIKINSALSATMGRSWQLVFGHDFWWQQKEKLGRIVVARSDKNKYRKDIATKPSALQYKMFGSIQYERVRKKYDIHASLSGDATLFNYGVGADKTVALRCGFSW